MSTGVGAVIHLHRIRNALRVLLIPADDPTRVTDATWLRQAETALRTLAAHHQALPAGQRAPFAVLIDPDAPPADRHQALLDAAQLMHLRPSADNEDARAASILRHPSHRTTHSQGRLFDPA